MTITVLYPFFEEAYSDSTEDTVETIKNLAKQGIVNPLIVVNKTGKISKLLKKARLSYEEENLAKTVEPNDFYFKALFKLMMSTLPLFRYFRTHKVDVVHCFDLLPLLTWSNVAKMNRIPYIYSVSKVEEKYSHYATLMIQDARKLICISEAIKEQLPPRVRSQAISISERIETTDSLDKKSLDENVALFWQDIYTSFFKKPEFSRTTGLLNNK